MKRYVAEADFYIYAESDEKAKMIIEEISIQQRLKYDSHFKVHNLTEQPFATLVNRKVKI